ncbi:uncharacterized protein TNCV_964341 [Trichonephila clavipes]|nr:uncharacterized protein TNCV_964341 [Trichonephila clavipes]
MNAAEWINYGASTSAVGAAEIMEVYDEIASILTPDCVGIHSVRSTFMKTHWAAASARFTTTVVPNPFGYKCDVYGRLWILCSLSRVTPLDSLYMTNTRNDFQFYHGFGQTSPTAREVRDDFQRLAQHPLSTLVAK